MAEHDEEAFMYARNSAFPLQMLLCCCELSDRMGRIQPDQRNRTLQAVDARIETYEDKPKHLSLVNCRLSDVSRRIRAVGVDPPSRRTIFSSFFHQLHHRYFSRHCVDS